MLLPKPGPLPQTSHLAATMTPSASGNFRAAVLRWSPEGSPARRFPAVEVT
jgi:hypothetical protein